MCEQNLLISVQKFPKMMDNCLPKPFDLSINPYDRWFVQGGDPSQFSAVSKKVMENLDVEKH